MQRFSFCSFSLAVLGRLVLVLAAFFSSPAGMLGSVAYGDEATEPAVALSPQDDALRASFTEEIAPLMERNCSGCHGERKQEAGLRFDQLSPAMSLDQDVSVWSSVRDALNSHEMPPPEETRQPSEQERQRIVDWIDTSLEQVAQRHRANRSSPMRRLTVNEYENTLQELFGAAVPFGKKLPAAPLSEYGYSRDAALLGVSALELEYFLDIARQSVDDYVIFGERIPDSEHYLIEFEDVNFRPGVAGGYSVDEPLTQQELLEKLQARDDAPVVYSDRTLFPLPDGPLDLSSEELNRSDRQKFHEQFAKFKSHQLHKAGELIARVHVAAKLGDDGSAPRLRFRIGDTLGMEFGAPIAGECDVTASIDKPQVCTFRIPFRHVPTAKTKR